MPETRNYFDDRRWQQCKRQSEISITRKTQTVTLALIFTGRWLSWTKFLKTFFKAKDNNILWFYNLDIGNVKRL